MAKLKEPTNPWVPREAHDKQIATLTDRCHEAETCVIDLINLIMTDGGDFLASHGNDWKAATKVLIGRS